jgi:polygalacturonase
MPSFIQTLGLGLSAALLVAASPMPAPTPGPQLNQALALEKRASCTFTDAAAVSKSKTSCATIVLNNIAVPSGTTLDMTKLTSGTHVSIPGDDSTKNLT